jgi:hypothetical protein
MLERPFAEREDICSHTPIHDLYIFSSPQFDTKVYDDGSIIRFLPEVQQYVQKSGWKGTHRMDSEGNVTFIESSTLLVYLLYYKYRDKVMYPLRHTDFITLL